MDRSAAAGARSSTPLAAGGGSLITRDDTLDALADTVRLELDVPVALVSLVLPRVDRQGFPGMAGSLPEPYGSSRETPLTHSFCRYVVHDRRPLVIEDARADARLRDNPAIDALGVVAYAGFPVSTADGTVVGSLCAIDAEPREWSERELDRLRDLAGEASRHLQEQAPAVLSETAASPLPSPIDSLSDVGQRSRLLLLLSEELADTLDVIDVSAVVGAAAREHLDCLDAALWLRQTEVPRSLTGLEEGLSLDPMTLCLVPSAHDGADDMADKRAPSLPMEEDSPVGAAAVRSEAIHFSTSHESLDAFPSAAMQAREGAETSGRRTYLPLISHGRLLGTLALLWRETGPLSDEQRLTVGALASYTAQAVERASLRQNRVDALITLQRAFMPTLPETDEVELAARYLPASHQDQIGGDWYDVRVPAPGRIELMVGDVMGHDIDAAAQMGQFRTMLRVLAATTDDGPATQVERLDRAAADLAVTGMATLVHGHLLRQHGRAGAPWEFVWTNAGHLPPVVLDADGAVTVLHRPPNDVFIGVMPDRPRHENRVSLTPGSTLLLFTDGLVERREEDLQRGFARLHEALTGRHGLALEPLLDGLLIDLLEQRREDDVAVLAVRLPEDAASSTSSAQA